MRVDIDKILIFYTYRRMILVCMVAINSGTRSSRWLRLWASNSSVKDKILIINFFCCFYCLVTYIKHCQWCILFIFITLVVGQSQHDTTTRWLKSICFWCYFYCTCTTLTFTQYMLSHHIFTFSTLFI